MPVGPSRTTVAIAWLAAASRSTLLAVALVLAWRRLAGALTSPLDAPTLAATGLAAAMLALAARSSPPGRLAGSLITAAVLAVAIALSLRGTSALGLFALWTPLIAEEVWFRARAGRDRKRGGSRQSDEGRVPLAPPHTAAFHPDAPAAPSLLADRAVEEVTQHLVRTRTADGSEVLTGRLRVALAAGQRIASMHVAFCPPFAGVPQADVDQLDGPEARIKVVQILPFGARFDLKLVEPGEEDASVLLEFTAQAGVGSRSDLKSDPQEDRVGPI